jgi:mannose-6-phosphate isomerase-like protein (cupin superfamily)
MAEEFAIGPGTKLLIISHDERSLEVEARYDGLGVPPPPHLHPAQREHFEVLHGRMHTRIAHAEALIGVGDELDIPPNTVHQMWNQEEAPAVLRWQTLPAGRTLDWFRELAALYRGESLGDPETLLERYSDVFVLAAG